jgi:hypothetical protein
LWHTHAHQLISKTHDVAVTIERKCAVQLIELKKLHAKRITSKLNANMIVPNGKEKVDECEFKFRFNQELPIELNYFIQNCQKSLISPSNYKPPNGLPKLNGEQKGQLVSVLNAVKFSATRKVSLMLKRRSIAAEDSSETSLEILLKRLKL